MDFSFLPDRLEATREMHRVLGPQGRVVIATWMPVSPDSLFGILCEVLDEHGVPDIAQMMRKPFNFLSTKDLAAPFTEAGFHAVDVQQVSMPFVIPGGIPQALKVASATPIAPKVHALPLAQQETIQQQLAERLGRLSTDGVMMGRMTTNILTASKLPLN